MIPSTFTILNHTIEVVFDNDYCDKQGYHGCWQPADNRIVLANRYKKNGKWVPYKHSIIYHTFYHELTHCILFYMNKPELGENEEFVDNFGGLLAQVILSAKE
jgi:hypothetical protein